VNSEELNLIENLLEDYAEIVFDKVHEHNKNTTKNLIKALRIIKKQTQTKGVNRE
tara:strand:+ start:492 stop:656 length:165 start_codon:yes stop_codon:yes gene_type:complete